MNDILCIIPYYDFHGNERLPTNHYTGVKSLQEQGVDTLAIEAVYDNQPRLSGDNTVQIDVQHPLWYKENLINLGIQEFRDQYKYIGWIDSGLLLNDGWVELALDKLHHVDLIQCFRSGNWFNEHGMIEYITDGYIYTQVMDVRFPNRPSPGGAWVARSSVLSDNFLYDRNIVGGGDSLLAYTVLRNGAVHSELKHYTQEHGEHYLEWHEQLSQRNLTCSYIRGSFTHLWHATLKQRQHIQRHQILKQYNYNPVRDLLYDPSGLLTYSPDVNTDLPDAIHKYLVHRTKFTPQNATSSRPASVRFLCNIDLPVLHKGHERIVHFNAGDTHPAIRIEVHDGNQNDIYKPDGSVILDVADDMFENGCNRVLVTHGVPVRQPMPVTSKIDDFRTGPPTNPTRMSYAMGGKPHTK